MTSYPPRRLGRLPVDATLGTELDPGEVHLSARAHRHIAEDHPAGCRIVAEFLPAVVADATFVGQAPYRARNMELVNRVRLPSKRGQVLVAIGLEPDDRGRYRVRSGYVIDEAKVESRRRTGHLRALKR